MIGLISIVALASITSIGSQNNQLFDTVGTTLSDVTESVGAGGTEGSGSPEDSGAFSSYSCRTILEDDPSASSGIHTIDPDGTGGVPGFDVWCDMSTDGGGWTLISTYSGSPDGNVYSDAAAFNATALTSTNPVSNAKLSDAVILSLIDGRSDAILRSVSAGYDTVIQRTDGGNVFDEVALGMTFQCKQVTASAWVPFQGDSSGCGRWGDFPGLRGTTWTQGCNYVGYNNTPPGLPCGNGQSFSSGFSVGHSQRQWNDAGYTSNGAVAGPWYVR
ncbi:MAG: hypothetical protein Alpg2KO_18320 [Alphaproteobacteria bacterium]